LWESASGSLFKIFSYLKFNFTKLYFLVIVLITSFRIHPFLDTPSFYGFLGFLILDTIIKIYKAIATKYNVHLKFKKDKNVKHNNCHI
jgi:hypothetical protein